MALKVALMPETGANELLTEKEWRARDDLRRHWDAFCDADVIPIDRDDFTSRLEEFDLVEFVTVTKRDLAETSFAYELGLELGEPCWRLTRKGRAVLETKP